jgi:DNA-binding PadR family transcriptional regulator
MPRRPHSSRQALALLKALLSASQKWQHGYDLMGITGIKSGTLYPLLIRLQEDGHLESEWQPPAPPARAPRHAYRLTASGRAFAHALIAEAEVRAGPASEPA